MDSSLSESLWGIPASPFVWPWHVVCWVEGGWRDAESFLGPTELDDLGCIPGTLPRRQLDTGFQEKWATVHCEVSGTQEGL